MQSTHLSLRLCALMVLASAHVITAAEAEVVYNNTTTPMLDASFNPPRIRYADSKTEYGDQLHLAGTGRMITDIYIEYYGNFTAQGDELGRVQIYNNRKVYDLYRQEPTDILYDSGFFPITPGFHTKRIPNVNTQVPDIITLGLSATGLAENEDIGYVLYSPPTVGTSFNEMWRKNSFGNWEAFWYADKNIDPSFIANAGIKIVAIVAPLQMDIQVTQNTVNLTWTSQGQNFQVERSETIDGTFQPVGTTTQRSWSETIDKSKNYFYRVREV